MQRNRNYDSKSLKWQVLWQEVAGDYQNSLPDAFGTTAATSRF
jgi:hypothetical protein